MVIQLLWLIPNGSDPGNRIGISATIELLPMRRRQIPASVPREWPRRAALGA
jgi:hypothetical protein